WQPLDPECVAQIDGLPWHDGFDEPLPLDGTRDDLRLPAAALLECCHSSKVQLNDLQATVVFPAAFNAAVTRCDNKAEVLSLATLRLARRILVSLPAGPAVVFCDKHGGRNHYAALLQDVFPDELVIVRKES